MRILLLISIILISSFPVQAQEKSSDPYRSTDYPLPRFVSLRADKVYVRTGPGTRYPIRWVFQKKELPVEVILEYDTWRKVKDIDGAEGWVHQSLLSGSRTAITQGDENIALHRKATTESRILAYAEPQVVVKLERCSLNWCLADAAGYKGWTPKSYLWGVYPQEQFN